LDLIGHRATSAFEQIHQNNKDARTVKPKEPVPVTEEGWLVEIAAAYEDAREAIPFGAALGEPFGETELFHLAPVVALKCRGIPRTRRNMRRATEAALASYIATRDANPHSLDNPAVAFAFCYLASHHGLEILSESRADTVIDYVERNRRSLVRLINQGRKPNSPLQPAAGVRLRELLKKLKELRARRG